MFSGSLPEKITYWCRESHKTRIDDEDEDNKREIAVTPTFVSDTTNLKTMETAEQWAGGGRYYSQKVKPAVRIDLDNEPRKGYKVVGMERRAQNGRVYKCIDAQGHYFDMPMEILLDIMTHSEVRNSEIMCPLVWCRVASNMKLVRFGSDLYDKVVEATNQKKVGKLKNLEVGRTYVDKKDESWVYIGNGSFDGKSGQIWLTVWNHQKPDPLDYMTKNLKQSHHSHPMEYLNVVKSKTVMGLAKEQLPVSYEDIVKWYAKHKPNSNIETRLICN